MPTSSRAARGAGAPASAASRPPREPRGPSSPTTEGRRASRIDFEARGRYPGIPPTHVAPGLATPRCHVGGPPTRLRSVRGARYNRPGSGARSLWPVLTRPPMAGFEVSTEACDAAAPTVQNGWEYGGWIYQVPGGWTYSEAQTTRMQRTIDPFLPPDLSRGTVGGWYHTHPVGVARPSDPDYEISFRYNVPGYVWGRRPAFGGDGPHTVAKFSGRKDPVEDLGSCSTPDVAPEL
jgi:hypothetical protein